MRAKLRSAEGASLQRINFNDVGRSLMSQVQQEVFHRFQVYLGEKNEQGKIQKKKVVGMSYLKEGQSTYTVRLWMFLNERFYLVRHKENPKLYYIMTREANRNEKSSNKYFWNIVGNGLVDAPQNCIALNFDLFDHPIYMSIFPEAQKGEFYEAAA